MTKSLIDNNQRRMSQSQRERLVFVDFQLYFRGEVRRADIERRFGVAPAAATRDLSLYRTLAPQNLTYDASTKRYAIGVEYLPLFEIPVERALAALRCGFAEGLTHIEKKQSMPVDTVTGISPPPLHTLALLSRAIHRRTAVTATYFSLSSGPSERTLVPLALVENGMRWHVRAFDRRKGRFGDFVINRLSQCETLAERIADHEQLDADAQWNRVVEFELVPHPGVKHPVAVAADYGMVGGILRLSARAAVAGYALHRWQIDCSARHALSPLEYHLWLRNTPTLYGVESAVLAPGYKVEQ